MKTILQFACIALLLVSSARADEDPVFSGPQPGETLPPLTVRDVLAEEVTDVDFIEKTEGKAVLVVFFHKRTRPAFGLTNALMKLAKTRKKQGLERVVVMLTEDPTETGNWMKRIRNLLPKDTLYGVSMDGAEGPGAYGLNREVALTVLVGKAGKVTANFALVQPSLPNDGPKIAKAVVDVTGGGKVPDIIALSRAGQAQRMRRPEQMKQKPLPDELGGMLRGLINKQATAEDVDKSAKDIEEFIARKANEEWKTRVGQIATNIISAGKLKNYGTEPAQEYLKKWSKEFGPKERPNRPDKESDKDRPKTGNKTDKPSDKADTKKKDAE